MLPPVSLQKLRARVIQPLLVLLGIAIAGCGSLLRNENTEGVKLYQQGK